MTRRSLAGRSQFRGLSQLPVLRRQGIGLNGQHQHAREQNKCDAYRGKPAPQPRSGRGKSAVGRRVAEALGAFPGVSEAAAYGVAIPGTEGRAGMAALVADEPLDLPAREAKGSL